MGKFVSLITACVPKPAISKWLTGFAYGSGFAYTLENNRQEDLPVFSRGDQG